MYSRLWFILLAVAVVQAQSFDSGSTGADGTLVLRTAGTVLFDPHAFTPPLNPSGDNVYHFATIHIGKDVTVRLSSKILNGPVFWLAQGPVQIDGTIDLNGADGGDRTPSFGGAGGYDGGAPRRPGYSPVGFTPNVFLVPLVGGSGGDGGETQSGGGGGGALLIASSTSITVNGAITANGGNSVDGGGSGGAIRLVAPVIDGSAGFLSAKGGRPKAADGRIRFEAFDVRYTGNLNDTPFAQGKPFGLFLPPNPPPSIRVVSISGVALSTPDFTLNQPSPVTVVIEAHNIPPGTTIELQFFAESGPDQTVTTTPLQGSLQLSRATASLTLPSGRSTCYVKATWKQPPIGKRQP